MGSICFYLNNGVVKIYQPKDYKGNNLISEKDLLKQEAIIQEKLDAKADKSELEEHKADTECHITSEEREKLASMYSASEIDEKLEAKANQTEIDDISHRVEELEAKPEVVVEQEYNSESENAQSGKAVAEAVKDFITEEALTVKADKSVVEEHISNSEIHVEQADKDKWNDTYSKKDVDNKLGSKADIDSFNDHITNSNIHVSSDEKTKWDDKVSAEQLNVVKEELQTEINEKLESMLHWKGSVPTKSALPQEDNKTGDVYNAEDTGANFAWTGNEWDQLSEDISGLAPKTLVEAHTNNLEIHVTKDEKVGWNDKYSKSEVEAKLADKADKNELVEKASITYVDEKLTGKADISALDTIVQELTEHKEDITAHITADERAEWGNKYTKEEVDEKLADKADTTALTEVSNKITGLETSLEDKADKQATTKLTERVETLEAKKADTVYDSESTNAQAGTAVAEAIDEVLQVKQAVQGELKEVKLTEGITAEAIDDKFANATINGTVYNFGGFLHTIEFEYSSEINNPAALYLSVWEQAGNIYRLVAKSINKNLPAANTKGVFYFNFEELHAGNNIKLIPFTEGHEPSSNEMLVNLPVKTVSRKSNDTVSWVDLNSSGVGLMSVSDKKRVPVAIITLTETVVSSILQHSYIADEARKETNLLSHIADPIKHLSQVEKQNLLTFLSGYDGTTTIKTIMDKLAEEVTESNLKEVLDKIDQKASAEELNAAKTELTGKIEGKADEAEVTELGARVTALEEKQIDQTITEDTESQNATSSKAVVNYVATVKSGLETKISEKADTSAVEALETKQQATDITLTQLQDTVSSLATTEVVTELREEVTKLGTDKADKTYVEAELGKYTTKEVVNSHTEDTEIHVKQTDKDAWNAKLDKAELTAVKTELEYLIDTKVESVFHWKGTVTTKEELKGLKDTSVTGDVYNVSEEGGANYVFDGTDWDKLSEDLSGFASSNELTKHITDTTVHLVEGDKAKWDKKADISDITAAKNELQTQIDAKVGQSEYEETLKTLATKDELEKKVDTDTFTAQLGLKANTTDLETHKADSNVHVTKEKQEEWNSKVGQAEVDSAIATYKKEVDSLLETKVETEAFNTLQETVNTKIDESQLETKLADYATSEQLTTLEGKVDEKANSSDLVNYATKESVDTLTTKVANKASTGDLTKHTENTAIHFSETEKAELLGRVTTVETGLSTKVEQSDLETTLKDYATVEALNTKANQSEVTTLTATVDKKLDEETFNEKIKEYATIAALTEGLETKAEQTEITRLDAEIAKKADESKLADYATVVSVTELKGEVDKKASTDDLTTHTTDKAIHFEAKEKEQLITRLGTVEAGLKTKVEQTELASTLESYVTTESLDELSTDVSLKATKEEVTVLEGKVTKNTSDIAGVQAKLETKAGSDMVEGLSERVTKLEAKPEPTVDQEFKGDSANAQSGVAIKAELDKLVTKEELATKANDSEVKALKTTVNSKLDTEDFNTQIAEYAKQEKVDEALKLKADVTEITRLENKFDDYATADSLTTGLAEKASQEEFEALQTKVETKADKTALNDYVLQATYDELVSKVDNKVDQTTFDDALKNYTENTKFTELQGTVEVLDTTVASKLDESKFTEEIAKYVTSEQHTTDLDKKADKTELETTVVTLRQEIDTKISSMFTYKGGVETYEALAGKEEGAKIGDTYNVKATEANYVWTGEEWDKLSENIEGLAQRSELTEHTGNAEVHFTTSEKAEWSGKIDKAVADILTKANTTALNSLSETVASNKAEIDGTIKTLQASIDEKAKQIDVDSHIKNEDIHFTGQEKEELYAQVEAKASTEELNKLEEKVTANTSAIEGVQTELAKKAATEDFNAHKKDTAAHFEEGEKQEMQDSITALQSSIGEKANASDLTKHKQDKDVHFTEEEKTAWKKDITDLQASVGTKAESTDLASLRETVETNGQTLTTHVRDNDKHFDEGQKAQITADITSIQSDLETKVDKEEFTTQLVTKASVSDVITLQSQVSELEKKVVTVDKEYSEETFATSPNAQSGVAVAGAIKAHEDKDIHITVEERTKWDKAVTDIGTLTVTVDGKANQTDLEEANKNIEELQTKTSATDTKVTKLKTDLTAAQASIKSNTDNLAAHTGNEKLHVSEDDRANWDGKADKTQVDKLTETVTQVQTDLSGKAGQTEFTALQETVAGIETTLEDKADKSEVEESLKDKVDTKTYETEVSELQTSISTNETAITGHIADDDKHVSETDRTKWDNTYSKTEVDTKLATKVENETFQTELGKKANQSALDTLQETVDTKIDDEQLITKLADYAKNEALETLQGEVDKKANSIDLEKYATTEALTSHTQDTDIHFTKAEKSEMQSSISSLEVEIQTKAGQTEVKTLSDRVGAIETELDTKADTEKVTELENTLKSKVDQSVLTNYATTERVDQLEQTVETKIGQDELTASENKLTQLIDSRVESMFHWKGDVENYAELTKKEKEAKVGDVWNDKETEANYVWNGKTWDKLSEDLTSFAKSADLTAHANELDKHTSTEEKAKWNAKAEQSSVTELAGRVTILEQRPEIIVDTTYNGTSDNPQSGKAIQSELDKLATKEELNDKADNATVSALQTKVEGKLDEEQFNKTIADYALKSDLDSKAEVETVTTLQSSLQTHTENQEIHFTGKEKEEYNTRLTAAETTISSLDKTYATKAEVTTVSDSVTSLTEEVSGKASQEELTALQGKVTANTEALTNKAETSRVTELEGKLDEKLDAAELDTKLLEYTTKTEFEEVTTKVEGKAEQRALEELTETVTANKTEVTEFKQSVAEAYETSTHAAETYAPKTEVTELSEKVTANTEALEDKVGSTEFDALETKVTANQTSIEGHTANVEIHLSAEDKEKINSAIISTQVAKIEVYLDPNDAPPLADRDPNTLYFIADAQ